MNDVAYQDSSCIQAIAHDEVRDWVDWEFWDKLLALELELLQVLKEQNVMMGQAMQATKDNHLVLATILGLAVLFIPAAAQPPSLQTPLQPPITCNRTLPGPGGGPPLFPTTKSLVPIPGLLPTAPPRAPWAHSCHLPKLHVGMELEVPEAVPGLYTNPAGLDSTWWRWSQLCQRAPATITPE